MPASGNLIQMTFNQVAEGATMQTIVHFRERSAATVPADWHAAAEQFLTALAKMQSNAVVYSLVIAKVLTPIAFDEDLYVPTKATGDYAQPLFNNTVSAIITKRTGISGARHRGRWYVSGLPNDSMVGNHFTSAGATRAGDFTSAVMAAFGESGTNTKLQVGLYSPSIGGTNPYTVAGWLPISRLDFQTIPGNQRRRRLGVGI